MIELQECKNHGCGLENYLGFGLGALFFLHITSGESEEREREASLLCGKPSTSSFPFEKVVVPPCLSDACTVQL